MKNILKKELHKILEIIDRCARCNDLVSFENTFKNLTYLLPYETSLCAIGDLTSLSVDKLVNNKVPLHYLQAYFTQEMIHIDPFIKKSLSLMKAHFCYIEDHKNNSAYRRFVEFKMSFGLTHWLTSAFLEKSNRTTFLNLAKPTEKPHQHHLQIVDFLMPHLHHAISRVYKAENGNNNLHNFSSLTAREIEVLKWIKEGKTNWEISQIINISEATVKFHLANILKKLDAVNRGHAVAKALENLGGL